MDVFIYAIYGAWDDIFLDCLNTWTPHSELVTQHFCNAKTLKSCIFSQQFTQNVQEMWQTKNMQLQGLTFIKNKTDNKPHKTR